MGAVENIRGPKIDELGRLADKIEPIKPAIKRYEELRKEIAGWFDGEPADKVFTELGKTHEVEISEKGEERTVNLLKLSKKLGPKKFLQCVTVPMKLLDQHVSPEEQKDLVTKERTGSRRVTVKRRNSGPKEAA